MQICLMANKSLSVPIFNFFFSIWDILLSMFRLILYFLVLVFCFVYCNLYISYILLSLTKKIFIANPCGVPVSSYCFAD